ncbi:uncharacterized protein SPPG_06554 [Spizellomyces punctatus DAOM BR117]|uniref:Uncharacterized protein n=1 Tax=Spizellomyces punctatus (strain DAOM BR117) TaxID=645134 RepID=A0A0L0H9E0_SPIPD|nr:uncharacterized protein SPPG_06554 [Spizellomyces punctatus DAOM BR117]KNC98150.1 hypothetical protein SPPG_06554 [Spizellomyces punctatus DAOM BR117]|eukprot:XP_016606190.1 hypothetical protein SPPG_06554 [Spizellomyces punctatus DAOM BR117]
MIPLGRSIPNITGPTGTPSGDSAQLSNQTAQEYNFQRRRSSLDAIMGHLKYVGQFPGRVLQDLSQPLSAAPRPIGQNFPPQLNSQTSLTSLGGSMADLGASTNTQAPANTTGAGKLANAEAFLSGV